MNNQLEKPDIVTDYRGKKMIYVLKYMGDDGYIEMPYYEHNERKWIINEVHFYPTQPIISKYTKNVKTIQEILNDNNEKYTILNSNKLVEMKAGLRDVDTQLMLADYFEQIRIINESIQYLKDGYAGTSQKAKNLNVRDKRNIFDPMIDFYNCMVAPPIIVDLVRTLSKNSGYLVPELINNIKQLCKDKGVKNENIF